ncbi:MAG: hypothetical protein HKN49_14045 [Gammaproteobacteria bacterium]|nr:hypothetical protein [Gammaproteobacteria bacterium]
MRPAIVRIICTATLAAAGLASGAALAQQSSANYTIKWDVVDSGGGFTSSTNYQLTDSVGQQAIGIASSTNYQLSAGFFSPPDTDTDTVRDFLDNCTLDINPDQLDTNSDGYGNLCDADLNNDLTINFLDLTILKNAFFTNTSSPDWNPDIDINGDGFVNFADLSFMKLAFFGPPGPSGIAP